MPPLGNNAAAEEGARLKQIHNGEREALDEVWRYWKGRQSLPAVIPNGVPFEVRRMAQMARVNVCGIVVDTLAQSTFVDGFRGKNEEEDVDVWGTWQANRMDRRQSGIHRATYAYGTGYTVVIPSSGVHPVIKCVSPRLMTTEYGDDPDWPMVALEKLDNAGLWRLIDEQAFYYLQEKSGKFEHIETDRHRWSVAPVVRYLDEEDLDEDDEPEPDPRLGGWLTNEMPTRGQISPLQALQDQIDLTTFNLLVAQHYQAFKQRYIIGWTADSEQELMKAGAAQIMTFDETKDEVAVGEFGQTDLSGYLDSREASLRHAATLSQTPVHELVGQLVNLSAEALAAAEAGKDRKGDVRKTGVGESHEQTFWLVGQERNIEIPDDAEVRWRDTSARAFAATVDGLGKMVQMLGIPPQEVWERVPGATTKDVERWKKAAEVGDPFAVFADLLRDQGGQPATLPA